MKRVNLHLCFLDEENNVVAKKDLNATWDLDNADKPGTISDVIVMDQVAAMLNSSAQEELYTHIRELLDEVRKEN